MVLSASDLQIEQVGKTAWIGGVVLASVVGAASAAFFLGSGGDEIFLMGIQTDGHGSGF